MAKLAISKLIALLLPLIFYGGLASLALNEHLPAT